MLRIQHMQPEEKAAIKAAGATALIAGAFAATIATPVAWAAVMLGAYRMGFEVAQTGGECRVYVFIDYNLPVSLWLQPLAWWMNRAYAVWCVDQMLSAVTEEFLHVQA